MNAIEFDHVGKQYRLGLVSTGTFSDDLTRWWTMHVRHKEDPYLKASMIEVMGFSMMMVCKVSLVTILIG